MGEVPRAFPGALGWVSIPLSSCFYSREHHPPHPPPHFLTTYSKLPLPCPSQMVFVSSSGSSPPGPLTSLVAQTVNRLSTMREIRIWSLGWEDPLEKEMAIHSSTVAWKIPWTEEPGRLQSMGSQRVGHDWATSRSGSSRIQRSYSSQTHMNLLLKDIYSESPIAWYILGS